MKEFFIEVGIFTIMLAINLGRLLVIAAVVVFIVLTTIAGWFCFVRWGLNLFGVEGGARDLIGWPTIFIGVITTFCALGKTVDEYIMGRDNL